MRTLIQTRILLSCLSLLVCACSSPAEEAAMDASPGRPVTSTAALRLDGYWILSEYLDSILADQSIAQHRLYSLSWAAYALYVHQDSLDMFGTVRPQNRISIDPAQDPPAHFQNIGAYIFCYNPVTQGIEAFSVHKPEPVGHYRRITEQYLIDILERKNGRTYAEGFNLLFTEKWLAGDYLSLQTGQKMRLDTNGKVSGFLSYNFFRLHDYFGTFHPFENVDVIRFCQLSDSDREKSAQFCPDPTYYSFKYSGDTLTLTEMQGNLDDSYFRGKNSWVFIRQ